MKTRLLLLIATFAIIPTCVMAEGCDVQTRSSSASVPAVETHSCYEYEGMPVDSINWSCSNESKDTLNATKKKSIAATTTTRPPAPPASPRNPWPTRTRPAKTKAPNR